MEAMMIPAQTLGQPPKSPAKSPDVTGLQGWVKDQALNIHRHLEAMRPFQAEEFGRGLASPSEGHIEAANKLLGLLRANLLQQVKRTDQATGQVIVQSSTAHLAEVLTQKEKAHTLMLATERIWDFFFELFGQRQSYYGTWLLGCDRIALDCYQQTYLGLGVAKSIPAPPPFAYMRTGFSPATFRRGIPLQKLGRQLNPFPLVQLPYHRLVNPWTLGAILHEVSHNFQNELGLERLIPLNIGRRLLQAGHRPEVARVWTQWNRELYADLSGLLLGGPAVVGSLMDVVGRSAESVTTFSPEAPHPVPYLRLFISIELLRRMGFTSEAEKYRRIWMRLYPYPQNGNIPAWLLRNFQDVIGLVVDTVCYQPYQTLGNVNLAQVIRFAPKEQQMVEEAARRLANGIDPGVVPERFLIGAVRYAFENRLARPEVLAKNFYKELEKR
jgi:hypothetical protein